jgi:DNA-binding FadR family transcriptional regulator
MAGGRGTGRNEHVSKTKPTAPIKADTQAPREPRGTGRRLYGAIAHKLGAAILAGEYLPGDVLSGEVVFSEQLDVSRSAYREAIQALAAKGLVESRPKAGTRVLPRSRWNLLDPEVLGWAFAGSPDTAFIRSLFELRAIVEPAAAALAAERRSKDDLKAMRDALAGMTRHTLATEAGRMADRDFHSAILHATGNDALIVLNASICAAVSWTTQFKHRQRALPRNPIPDHRRVLVAIADGDATAASEAMRVLVELALEDTQQSMQP